MNSEILLSVRHLAKSFPAGKGHGFRRATRQLAVRDVSFELHTGEVLSLVGESGCGKTTIGRLLTRLDTADAGEALYRGRDILALSQRRFRPLRREIQMIFQDPFASLNPRLTIGQTLAEPLRIHGLATEAGAARQRIDAMLAKVGLDASAAGRYPHAFSGGQRQRIGIARVMIVEPRLIIADEAVSALDVSIQAQVLNLIKQLQRDSGISLLFISHDLGVVRHLSDRIAVMHAGEIVELADKHALFANPQHPYTQRLLDAIPRLGHYRDPT